MLLVMLVLAVAVILGVGYLSSASIDLAGSNNLLAAARAQYLAESGLQHAMYVLRADPTALDGSAGSPLGPFYADESSDGYQFYAVPIKTAPGYFVVTAEAEVDGICQRRSSTVFRTAAPTFSVDYGLMIGGGMSWLPRWLTVNGNFHINGTLFNFAILDGDASATGVIIDPLNRIQGESNPFAPDQEMPSVQWSDYQNYNVFGVNHTAIKVDSHVFQSNDPLADGGAVGPSNVGGVVWFNHERREVKLKNNLNFEGTIIVNGDVILEGNNITLTAVEGFPAIVASGKVIVKNGARATINGMIVSTGGIRRSGNTSRSATTINGGLVCAAGGYQNNLMGTHTLNYVEDRCMVYDFSDDPEEMAVVEVIEINE